MPTKSIDVRPSSRSGYVLSEKNELMKVPEGWALLKPGDAALSRRIKADGPSWTIKEKKGKKVFSQGILAPAIRIEALRQDRERELQSPKYQKQLAASRARRAKEEEIYKIDFQRTIFEFLDFHQNFEDLAIDLAIKITEHAIPVGSGTVARTKSIPVEQRAEAATIAWMRHQTTSYDHMTIPKVKGKRREVRQMLAKKSREILGFYRAGGSSHLTTCPLYLALHT